MSERKSLSDSKLSGDTKSNKAVDSFFWTSYEHDKARIDWEEDCRYRYIEDLEKAVRYALESATIDESQAKSILNNPEESYDWFTTFWGYDPY